MRRLAIIASLLVAGCWGAFDAHPFEGSGILVEADSPYCIALDLGTTRPIIDTWPSGLHVAGDGTTLVDDRGQTVLQVGDRIAVKGTIGHMTGDTDCPDDDWFTFVDTYQLLSRGVPSPSPN